MHEEDSASQRNLDLFGNLCSQQAVATLHLYLASVTTIILSSISVLGVLHVNRLSCQAQGSA